MGIEVKAAEKLTHRFRPDATFEAKHKQGGHDQADKREHSVILTFPVAAVGTAQTPDLADLPLKKALEFSVLPSISASYKNRAWPQCGH